MLTKLVTLRGKLISWVPSGVYRILRQIWYLVFLNAGKFGYLILRSLGRDYNTAPPSYLIVQYGAVDRFGYMRYGQKMVEMIDDALRQAAVTVEAGARVLDFGCGCGRVTEALSGRGWQHFVSDIKHDPVAWIRRYRSEWVTNVNGLRPPLPGNFEGFGLIFAISVLTHMDEMSAKQWLDHFHQRLAPGGVLFLTIITPEESPEQIEKFGILPNQVVQDGYVFDQGKDMSFIAQDYVRSHFTENFDLLHMGKGKCYSQTALVLRKK
tara:strand:+ start:16962 stop:17759 length:798 start_codon:yes stop_codon:yes gene_type:complete